ncbi:MAG: hypothetical protein FJ218_08515 [Ignavibacteria bacterium]|nr:hypothetical protein [Ignavibacteria bacterium]
MGCRIQKGYDKELGSEGKTPIATLSALIYKDINENKEESQFVFELLLQNKS